MPKPDLRRRRFYHAASPLPTAPISDRAFGSTCLGQLSSIRGEVTDPSGAVVPRAKMTVKNKATGVTQTTISDNDGNYVATSLAPGEYEVSATADGFRPATINLTLQTAQTLDVPVKLALVSSTQTVEVTGQTPLLNTDDSRLQKTLDSHELESLPLQGRTMVGLISTAPGVTGLGLLTGGAPQSAPDEFLTEIQNNVNANGRSFNTNLYVVDGLDVTSSVRPGDLITRIRIRCKRLQSRRIPTPSSMGVRVLS